MNEYMENKLKEAGELLDAANVSNTPKLFLYATEGLLSNLKCFIYDNEIREKINKKEEEITKEVTMKINELKENLKDKDPLMQWTEGSTYELKLHFWKCRELLAYWNKILREYEII